MGAVRLTHVPLLLVPFLLYNAFAFLIFRDWERGFSGATIFKVPMPSGAEFALTVSASIVLMALVLLAVEVIKATRPGGTSAIDHILAAFLFILFLVEFLFVPQAATSTFFVLMAVACADLVCGLVVSMRPPRHPARPDMSVVAPEAPAPAAPTRSGDQAPGQIGGSGI